MTDKHDDRAVPFDHPPRLVYAKTPRREIDFEALDFRWISHHSDPETRLSRFFGAIREFLSRLKRRQSRVQATYNEHSLTTADDNAKALAERLALDAALFPKPQPSAAELAERQALDADVRRELEHCTAEELELLADLKIMFGTNCPPETRARSTTQRRIAQELLDERAGCASSYQPDNVTIACSKRPYTAGDKRFD